MYKELLLAIILGSLLGFGVTGGIIAMKKNSQNGISASSVPTLVPDNQPTQANAPKNASPTPPPVLSAISLTIDTPENESIVSTSKTTVSGTTQANSLVIIRTPISSYQTTTDNAGNFSLDIELETGVNFVKITAINSDNQQNDTQLIVTYSTAKI